jgi:hypothetical protein
MGAPCSFGPLVRVAGHNDSEIPAPMDGDWE